MTLLGKAIVAIWNDVKPDGHDNFLEWHVREHMPERLRIAGFLRGRRFRAEAGASQYFTLYEAENAELLVGDEYLARLNNPTEWTLRTTSQFLNAQRGVCKVVWQHGYGEGAWLITMRFDIPQKHSDSFQNYLLRKMSELPAMMGITGVSLCIADQEASSHTTTERKGRDVGVPDWIVMIEGTSRSTVTAAAEQIAASGMEAAGASNIETGCFRVEFSLLS
ncbi:DUF4286 family protein [Devosia sp.]|uniref:DUF4286 family protein n=1 Tax=Devosia sp. TaxID=1871048 RepID=UPI002736DCE4|nr:DUF4286 family protein [Devosia sp.]MDP2781532.1 hypothetical protein [Devosia sp.]